jgi:hypothetical protein
MSQRRVNAASTLRVHIGRLVVDAAALGELPSDQLASQLQSALAERLSGNAARTPRASGPAGRIADNVATAVQQRMSAAGGGRDGAV